MAISACSPPVESSENDRTAVPRISVPLSADNTTERGSADPDVVRDLFEPKIPIDQSDTVIAVYNINLDLETSEEQILLVKHTREASAPIRVIVVVYDTVVEGYVVSFEAATHATNARSTELSFVDMVGDHSIEIVCQGMNEAGHQTLDVYRKTASPSGFGLYYEPIAELDVDGTIEIERTDRSEAYRDGFANGESFTIKTLRTPPDSENLLDLDETRYFWRFAEKRYVMGQEQRISGEVVEQTQLRELYRSGANAFATFLSGVWFLEKGEYKGEAYLQYDPRSEQFTYFAGDIQEVYSWSATYKILVNQVELAGVNELIPYIRKNLYVQVAGLDSIRILGSDPWKGTYRRIAESKLVRKDQTPYDNEKADFELAGAYFSDVGEQLLFHGDEFDLEENGTTLHGLFSVYSVGKEILELKIKERTGVISESRRYHITYQEETRDDRIYRTILLEPGVIGIYGFEATGDGYIRYEQIEQIEPK